MLFLVQRCIMLKDRFFIFLLLLCTWSCSEDLFHRDITENNSMLKSIQYRLLKGSQLFTAPNCLAAWVPAATESSFGGELSAVISATWLYALHWGAAKAILLPFTANFLMATFVV